jgi:kynurenine formamidase
MAKRWNRRPEGSNWGEFGENDQIGRLNLLNPERVLTAAREIRTGRTFILSLPLDIPGGKGLSDKRRGPQFFSDGIYNTSVADILAELSGGAARPGCLDVSCDDGVTLFLQYSTQWDALCHFGALFDAQGDGKLAKTYYNGWGSENMLTAEQGGPFSKKLGIENVARTGVQGRGVLVDLVREYGYERKIVRFDELNRIMDKQRVVVEAGDIVCLRTGYAEVLLEMGDNPDREKMSRTGSVLDGSDPALLDWIAESNIAAICSDNLGVEEEHGNCKGELSNGYTMFPLHHLCLFKLGVHLGELWYFRELGEWLETQGRTRFFLTAPPLNLPGAAGSPATPVATV